MRLGIKFFLIVIGIISLIKCRQHQKEISGNFVFHGMSASDPNFEILNNNFAKDSIHVYFRKYIIPDADISSFNALNDHYAKDANSVYYCDEFREGKDYFITKNKTINIIKNADPSSFIVLNYGYAKDKNQAYMDGRPLKVKDVASFSSIGAFISKDKIQAYYLLEGVKGIDGQSFELINGFYAKDKNNYYFFSYPNNGDNTIHKITPNDSPLEILDHPYSKNKTHVFYEAQKLTGLNPNTTEVINSSFAKDDKDVMYGSNILRSADATTFKVPEQINQLTNSEYFTYDKNLVFFGLDIIYGAKPDSFTILGYDYSSDKKYIYYKTSRVASADYKTFKILEHSYDGKDAEDSKYEYFQGKIINTK